MSALWDDFAALHLRVTGIDLAIGTRHLFYGQEATVVGQGITYDDKYAFPQEPVPIVFIECPALFPGMLKLRDEAVLALGTEHCIQVTDTRPRRV